MPARPPRDADAGGPGTAGADAPALLLLHATLSSSRDLGSLARHLGAAYRVTGVDRRGTEAVPIPADEAPGPIDVAVHVADLVTLIEAERLAPVTLVGHSYGGCLALELAARHPRLVAAAWVYEPPYAPAGPPAARAQLEEVSRRTAEAQRRSGLGAAAETFLANVAGEEAVAALAPAARERIRAQGSAVAADAALLGLDPGRLAGIGCPVVIATGTASRPVYAEIADALVARIQGASHRQLGGADHMAPVTRPAAVAAAILSALG